MSLSLNLKNEIIDKYETTHPIRYLIELSTHLECELISEHFSQQLDQLNIWPSLRSKFLYPKLKDLPRGNAKMPQI